MSKVPDPAEIMGLDNFKGTHRGGYAKDKLSFVRNWIMKYPFCTLTSGEGRILLDEIERLEALLSMEQQDQP